MTFEFANVLSYIGTGALGVLTVFFTYSVLTHQVKLVPGRMRG